MLRSAARRATALLGPQQCVQASGASARCWSSAADAGSGAFATIAVHEQRVQGYAVLELNRPKQLNALSTQVMQEVLGALAGLDADPGIKAVVITGSGKAFAAGADIKEMAGLTQQQAFERQLFAGWQQLRQLRLPLVAAVNGYALGGGCELALLCDVIIASEAAQFGLPELSLGVIPGIGGTQRLPRLVGRALAMDMVLTGRRLTASEALAAGLVSRVVPADKLAEEAGSIAGTIASWSAPAVAEAKACIHATEELGLAAGVELERRYFWGRFDSPDQKQGMDAFVGKRKPSFRDL